MDDTAMNPRTPSSITGARSRSAGADCTESSCYFPGCRKDANCSCEICLASMDATRDLRSYPRLTTKKQSQRSIQFDLRTPPPVRPTVKSTPLDLDNKETNKKKEEEEGERSRVFAYQALGFVVTWLILWAVDLGFISVVTSAFGIGPKLKAETVVRLGEESRSISGDLNPKLSFLQERIDLLVRDGRAHDCSAMDSNWSLNQEGQIFFHWRCVIYKSIAEEVSVWGSPIRTSGLLPTNLSPRSLTLLSGKFTEWSNGRLRSALRASNSSSWTYEKWSSVGIQLEADTWVLEYERSALYQGPRLYPVVWEILRSKFSKLGRKLKSIFRVAGLSYYNAGEKCLPPT